MDLWSRGFVDLFFVDLLISFEKYQYTNIPKYQHTKGKAVSKIPKAKHV
ncbi:MAG: hypothetical protein AAF611_04330 [Bacteroidota bacterium]